MPLNALIALSKNLAQQSFAVAIVAGDAGVAAAGVVPMLRIAPRTCALGKRTGVGFTQSSFLEAIAKADAACQDGGICAAPRVVGVLLRLDVARRAGVAEALDLYAIGPRQGGVQVEEGGDTDHILPMPWFIRRGRSVSQLL